MAHANLKYAVAAVMLLTVAPLAAHAAPEAIIIELDKSKGAEPVKRPAADLVDKLAKSPLVCLDLRVKLDGQVPDTIKRSAEEANPNAAARDLVPCGPQMTGQLTMGPGIEYYLTTQGASGNRVDLSIYPGTRTEHISNDVACAMDETGKAYFSVRGLFRPLVNRYAEVDSGRKPTGKTVMAIQLRPIAGTRPEAAGCPPTP